LKGIVVSICEARQYSLGWPFSTAKFNKFFSGSLQQIFIILLHAVYYVNWVLLDYYY